MLNLAFYFLVLTTLHNNVYAVDKWEARCKVKKSSTNAVKSVVLSGPLSDRDFRLRLLDQNGNQLETGACDFTGECYSKDWTGHNDVLESLSIKFKKNPNRKLNLEIFSGINRLAELECSFR